MRCLALAQAWQDAGGNVVFAMAASTFAIDARLRSEGMEIVQLTVPPNSVRDARDVSALARHCQANWVVVDGYQFDSDYQHAIKGTGLKLLWVDDLGQCKSYFADLILNQNPHAQGGMYGNREPFTRLLLGTRYTLLRREFKPWRLWNREASPAARKILVTMGGSDPENITARVLEAFSLIDMAGLEARLVVAGSNPHIDFLRKICGRVSANVRLLIDPANIPELMAWADVAISAAGTTCWEICLLGLPAILIHVAENQLPVACQLARMQAAIHLGAAKEVSAWQIASQLQSLLIAAELRMRLSQNARAFVDGRGAERVVSAMRSSMLRLRRVEEKDCQLLWDLANDPGVRASSFSPEQISWTRHQTWFERKLNDPNCMILIAEDEASRAVGQFRVDETSPREGEIDVSLSPEARGLGLGASLIELGVRSVFASTGIECLHAFVKPENRASMLAFARAEFVRTGDEEVDGRFVAHFVRTRDPQERGAPHVSQGDADAIAGAEDRGEHCVSAD